MSALFSRASRHFGLPVALLFLFIGMAAGAEGIGGLQFQDYGFAFRVGTVALVLILFDGGLSTPAAAFRAASARRRCSPRSASSGPRRSSG